MEFPVPTSMTPPEISFIAEFTGVNCPERTNALMNLQFDGSATSHDKNIVQIFCKAILDPIVSGNYSR